MLGLVKNSTQPTITSAIISAIPPRVGWVEPLARPTAGRAARCADIPPDRISPSNLACLNRILAYATYFSRRQGYVSAGSSDATYDIRCCSAGSDHTGASAFLVSTCLLWQYGLLPSRLRSVGRNGFPVGSMSLPATCSNLSKCSRVKTTIAMCVSVTLVITARFARSSCQTCSGTCPDPPAGPLTRQYSPWKRASECSSLVHVLTSIDLSDACRALFAALSDICYGTV